jgi:hypothetical protein
MHPSADVVVSERSIDGLNEATGDGLGEPKSRHIATHSQHENILVNDLGFTSQEKWRTSSWGHIKVETVGVKHKMSHGDHMASQPAFMSLKAQAGSNERMMEGERANESTRHM